MSLLMLRSTIKLGGVVGLSSYLPMHEELPLASDENLETPVLLCHGDCDQVVHYKYGEASFDLLRAAGCKVEFQAYDFMGHEACPEELQALRDFLKGCFAPPAKRWLPFNRR